MILVLFHESLSFIIKELVFIKSHVNSLPLQEASNIKFRPLAVTQVLSLLQPGHYARSSKFTTHPLTLPSSPLAEVPQI